VNLNTMIDQKWIAIGWCRGLTILNESQIIVGFSRLRPTKWRENIRWVKRQFGRRAGTRPTRIALYDLQSSSVSWEYNMEKLGMDAIFSIHPVEA
jgi:hypothetical protein